MVLTDRSASGKRVIVCTDRIAKAQAHAAVIAANSKDMERNAYARALDGLRVSRARMMQEMDGQERNAALAGVDTAMAELEAALARAH